MVSWIADENLNNGIVRDLLRRRPDLDIVRVQDAGLSGVDDAALLAWAAAQNRILITHDASTVTAYTYRRLARGEYMPGVFEVRRSVPVSVVIEDVLLISECGTAGEWEGRSVIFPFADRPAAAIGVGARHKSGDSGNAT
jgi:hypothetical protein